MTLFWTLFLIVSVLAEALTTALVAIWFIPGALLAVIFSALHFPLWTQLLAFFVSALGIIFRVAETNTSSLRQQIFHERQIHEKNKDYLHHWSCQ